MPTPSLTPYISWTMCPNQSIIASFTGRGQGAPTWIVGLASSFGPVVSVFVAVAIWRERLRPNQWLGLVGLGAGLVAVALP